MPHKASAKSVLAKNQAVDDKPAKSFHQLASAPIADANLQLTADAPHLALPADILALQRLYGNHAVQRLLDHHAVQPKLNVGPAGEAEEQEADRVANQVMAQPDAPGQTTTRLVGTVGPGASRLQRADDIDTMEQPQLGQAPLDLKDAYAYRHVYRSLRPAEVKRIIKLVLTEELPTALTHAQSDPNWPANPTPTEATQILEAYKGHVDAGPHDNIYTAFNNVWNDAALAAINNHNTVINKLYNLLKKQFIRKVRSLNGRLDREIDERQRHLDQAKVGTVPALAVRQRFAAALRSLPGLQEIIKQIKGKGAVAKQDAVIGAKSVEWQDSGPLTDKIVKRPAEPAQAAAQDLDSEFNTVKADVQKADNFYRGLVEPGVLSKIKRPAMVYHLVVAFDRAGGPQSGGKNSFVAHQSGPEIHFGQGVLPQILVHEIGHFIEDNLPRESWLELQLLLRSRHAAAGGGGHETESGGGMRLKGAYPATGTYTSRAYTTGTEVSSMMLERLAQTSEIDNLIDQDPQLVAVVIRALRPNAYKDHRPLRDFDAFLP